MQQTEQWKRNTNRTYLKRRQLAGEKKNVLVTKYLKKFTNFANSNDYVKI